MLCNTANGWPKELRAKLAYLFDCGLCATNFFDVANSVCYQARAENKKSMEQLLELKFCRPKGPCCSTSLAKLGELQPSKKGSVEPEATSWELLARIKKEGVSFFYPTVKTPSDLLALLQKIMLEDGGAIETDCAALVQIALFMKSDEKHRPSHFVLAFGQHVWEQTTYYQRQRDFGGLDVDSLCAYSLHQSALKLVVLTIDAVALTFGENVSPVTKSSQSHSSHWLCVDRDAKDDKLLGFTGQNADNQIVRMSLEEWFDFLVRGVDEEMKALKDYSNKALMADSTSDKLLLANSLVCVHACYMGLNAYKFEEAMVLVVGAHVPVKDFLEMVGGSSD